MTAIISTLLVIIILIGSDEYFYSHLDKHYHLRLMLMKI